MNANTLEDSIDQYDSMIKEKAIADPNRARPALAERLPVVGDAGLAAPVAGACRPSATAGMNYGTIERAASANGSG